MLCYTVMTIVPKYIVDWMIGIVWWTGRVQHDKIRWSLLLSNFLFLSCIYKPKQQFPCQVFLSRYNVMLYYIFIYKCSTINNSVLLHDTHQRRRLLLAQHHSYDLIKAQISTHFKYINLLETSLILFCDEKMGFHFLETDL